MEDKIAIEDCIGTLRREYGRGEVRQSTEMKMHNVATIICTLRGNRKVERVCWTVKET